MGSGEGDAVHVSIEPDAITNVTNVTNLTDTASRRVNGSLNWDGGRITNHSGDWWQPTYTYVTPSTVYLYQIKCPKCAAMNFMQLEFVSPCKKCKSRLKATTKTYEYEVPVEL